MAKITIDGKEVVVEEGKTILDAARQHGIRIPTLCSHPPQWNFTRVLWTPELVRIPSRAWDSTRTPNTTRVSAVLPAFPTGVDPLTARGTKRFP